MKNLEKFFSVGDIVCICQADVALGGPETILQIHSMHDNYIYAEKVMTIIQIPSARGMTEAAVSGCGVRSFQPNIKENNCTPIYINTDLFACINKVTNANVLAEFTKYSSGVIVATGGIAGKLQ